MVLVVVAWFFGMEEEWWLMSSVCEAASSEAADTEARPPPFGVGDIPNKALKLGLGGILGGVRDLLPDPIVPYIPLVGGSDWAYP